MMKSGRLLLETKMTAKTKLCVPLHAQWGPLGRQMHAPDTHKTKEIWQTVSATIGTDTEMSVQHRKNRHDNTTNNMPVSPTP